VYDWREKNRKTNTNKMQSFSEMCIEEIPKKDADLISDIEDFVKKYNLIEIKKQNLTKENLKKFTDKYFDNLDKIKEKLKVVENPLIFFIAYKNLCKEYYYIEKNFVKRVKAEIKKNK